MTKRVVCSAFAVFSAVCAVAMPSRSDLKKVQPTVNELMSEDIAAMKSGKQTPEGAAAKAEELAEMATDEASKFLLYKGAFGLYVQGGKYGAAIAALDKLTAAVKDVPDKVLADIVRSKMDGVKKALAENRVSEVTGKEVAEGALVAQPKTEAKNVNAGQVAASQSANYLNVPIDMRKLSPIKIPLKDATALEFVPIPAGKFHAGRCGRTGLHQSVDVVITRPFLMAKTPLTYAQWRALFGAEHPFERSLRTVRCPPVQVEVYQKLGKSALMACCNFHDSEYALAELNRKGGGDVAQGICLSFADACRSGVRRSGRG